MGRKPLLPTQKPMFESIFYKILTNAATARPRCEIAFFSSALISANDLS